MRTANHFTEKGTNKIAIGNYGSVTVQEFNQRLSVAGRLEWEFYYTQKKHTIWTAEKLVSLVNENEDLFPNEF